MRLPGSMLWNVPAQQRAAAELAQELRIRLEEKKRLNPGKKIWLLCSGSFGELRVLKLGARGADSLVIFGEDSGGTRHEIIASISQCSFRFSIIPEDTAEGTEDRIITGLSRETGSLSCRLCCSGQLRE